MPACFECECSPCELLTEDCATSDAVTAAREAVTRASINARRAEAMRNDDGPARRALLASIPTPEEAVQIAAELRD